MRIDGVQRPTQAFSLTETQVMVDYLLDACGQGDVRADLHVLC